MAEIHLQDGETLESALRRFKRLVLREEIIKEIKRHSFYLKPGEKKRVKAALARKRNRKKRSRDAAPEPARLAGLFPSRDSDGAGLPLRCRRRGPVDLLQAPHADRIATL